MTQGDAATKAAPSIPVAEVQTDDSMTQEGDSSRMATPRPRQRKCSTAASSSPKGAACAAEHQSAELSEGKPATLEASVTESKPAQARVSGLPPKLPAIFAYPYSGLLCAVLSGYAGGRSIFLLGAQGPEAWTATWFFAGTCSALSLGFAGGTGYVFLMHRSPRRFAWQNPQAICFTLMGCALAPYLIEHCHRGGFVDLDAWVGIECGQAFVLLDCLNLSLLVAWAASKSFTDLPESGTLAKLFWTNIASYCFLHGGGILRDVTLLCLGIDVSIGNFKLVVIVPSILATTLYLYLLRLSPLLQLGIGLPFNFMLFYFCLA